MSLVTLSPQSRKLREAVKEYCGKTGVNAATLGTVTEKFVGLLAARWEHICDVALAEENEGKVNVGLRIAFDMTHKTPVGSLTLSFSQRTRDESTFQVEDPDQGSLPFAEVVRQAGSSSSASPEAQTSSPVGSSGAPFPSRRSRRSSAAGSPNHASPEAQATPTSASGTGEQEVVAPRRASRRRPALRPQPATATQDTPF